VLGDAVHSRTLVASQYVVLGDAVHRRTLVASQYVVLGDAVHRRTLVASQYVVLGDAVHRRTLVASPYQRSCRGNDGGALQHGEQRGQRCVAGSTVGPGDGADCAGRGGR
jgi:hypothetical protein